MIIKKMKDPRKSIRYDDKDKHKKGITLYIWFNYVRYWFFFKRIMINGFLYRHGIWEILRKLKNYLLILILICFLLLVFFVLIKNLVLIIETFGDRLEQLYSGDGRYEFLKLVYKSFSKFLLIIPKIIFGFIYLLFYGFVLIPLNCLKDIFLNMYGELSSIRIEQEDFFLPYKVLKQVIVGIYELIKEFISN
jgi:hypothetical protein